MTLNEVFKAECEEIGIDFSEFPFDFPTEAEITCPDVIKAMMWVLKKRQDIAMNL